MFVTVKLAKFTNQQTTISSDLDKPLYTTKTLHTVTEPAQWPQFWTEEWLKRAIDELDTRAMSPEERLQYEMTLSANAFAVKNEKRKIDEMRKHAIIKALCGGRLTVDEIADYNDVPADFVLTIQGELI